MIRALYEFLVSACNTTPVVCAFLTSFTVELRLLGTAGRDERSRLKGERVSRADGVR